MFPLLRTAMLNAVGKDSIETAEAHTANGLSYNDVIDSNDEPPQNNQQSMAKKGI